MDWTFRVLTPASMPPKVGSSLPPAWFIWKDAVAQRLYSADACSKWSRSWVLFSLSFTDRDAMAC